MNVSQYSTLIFDCDGVILNSNRIKTQAFYKAALPYGETAAKQLVDYHVKHGGVSRYEKFEVFLKEIVKDSTAPDSINNLLAIYAEEVFKGLLCCDVAENLDVLRRVTQPSKWLIVSGGDQEELRKVFKSRGMCELFDGGIFGSPDNKVEILTREINVHNITKPALFIGDSKYDHIASTKCGLDFVFVSQWTDFFDWSSYVIEHNLSHVNNISELVNLQ